MTENRRNKMHHPLVTGGVIVSIAALLIGGMKSVNSLENQIESNSGEIRHERELRMNESDNIKEKLDELKQDSKDLKKEVKESGDEIKKLINQLIIKRQ